MAANATAAVKSAALATIATATGSWHLARRCGLSSFEGDVCASGRGQLPLERWVDPVMTPSNRL
jgi:hypothetical protein